MGTYWIESGTLVVELSDAADGAVAADAVWIVDPPSLYWDTNGATPGLGGSGQWDTTTANWSTSPDGDVPTQTWDSSCIAVFAGTAGTVSLDGAISAYSLQFDTDGYLLENGLLEATDITVKQTVVATIDSVITGASSLNKYGAGRLVLGGNNTYSGDTHVEEGTLSLGSDSALGGGGTVHVSTTLDLAGHSPVVSGLSGAGTITSSAAGTANLIVDNGDWEESTFAGVIEDGSGTVSLAKSGTGTLYLTGDNTYSGGTTISGGTLYLGNWTTSGTLGTGPVTNDAVLAFRRSDAATVANAISGTGSVRQENGTITLTGANTYSGGTTVYDGATLRVGGTEGTVGTGPVTAGDDGYGGGYGDPAELVFDRDTEIMVTNSISGNLHLVQEGTGTLVLAGSSTYSGGTLIAGGSTLRVGSAAGDILGQGTVAIDGTLDLNGYNPTVSALSGAGTITSSAAGTANLIVDNGDWEESTFAGVIEDGSGTVSLVKSGTGTLYLTGDNTYSGGTTISGGTLYLGNWTTSGTLGTGPVTNDAVLAFRRSDAATVANAISGSGSVRQEYGTITLTGANTYSGGTTIYFDTTLRVGGAEGSLGSGEVTAWDDGYGGSYGQLVFDRQTDMTVENDITGQLHVVQEGAGVVVLTGENTYSQGTTIVAGSTLQVGDGGSAGSLGTGDVIIDPDAVLAIDRSDTLTLENTLSGQGTLRQEGSGTVVFPGESSIGSVSITNGTLRVEGSLTSSDPLVNSGTLLVVGDGAFTHAGTEIAGSAAALSAGEVFLTSTGLGSAEQSFEFQISTDGATWHPIATGGGSDFQVMLSGLGAASNYYLRSRADYPGGGQIIYDGGMVTTAEGPGPGVPDTSGWYRVRWIESDSDGSRLEPAGPSTAYVDPRNLPQATQEALGAVDPQVHVFGDPNSPPPGSDCIFNLDHSWFYADSPQGAVLQAVVGLVTDGSLPAVTDELVKVWHVWAYEGGDLLYDLWTFDEGSYPDGGYSAVYGKEGYTLIIEHVDIPTPCTDQCCNISGTGDGGTPTPSCGSPGNTGGARATVAKIDYTGGAPACAAGHGAGLTYSSREVSLDTGFGPGWSDADELPLAIGGQQNVMVRLGTEQSVWFDAQDGGGYSARYGAKDTLTHDTQNHLFIFTRQDGTRMEFFDFDQTDRPQGGLYRIVRPGGATTEVTAWTAAGIDGRIAEVVDKVQPNAQPYQKRLFTYTTTDDGCQHVQSLTLQSYDESTSTWNNVRRITYHYYADGESYGLPGDLKKIVTQQWDSAAQQWTGDDTNYFRYYTDTDGAHRLRRVLLPGAYAAFTSTYGEPDDPSNPNAGDSQDDPIAGYTCFYYEYNADGRVTNRVVFGQSGQSSYSVTLSGNSRQTNYWHHKSVEWRPDGSTYTVYSNHLGQPILTDLADSEGNHYLTYNRYDDSGRLLLVVESSAFEQYDGAYYDESLPDLVDFASGDSPYLSNSEGLFHVTTYYDATSPDIDEQTAGGVAGYRYQRAVACGETAARGEPGSQDGPVLLSSYTYYARSVGDVTIYPLATYTTYAGEDGTGAITTSYAYSWYPDSFQVQEQTITLPAVPVEQNGSGTSAVRHQWFNAQGQLVWTADELGRVSYYAYGPLTGRLAQSIEDIDSSTASSLGLTPPAGWTLPDSGANLTTDYQYDAFGRLVQTLGPVHTAIVDGQPAQVRTATWTFYDDAAHETRSAQGYAQYDAQSGKWDVYTIVGPIWITRTDRDGRTTERIQAAYNGTLDELPGATIAQSDYTAWTTYQYRKTRLVSTRIYDDIPASGTGTEGVNYDQTTYGYESFGQEGLMGRRNRIQAADGTITRLVYDARGNVVETWLGTDDTGATDTDPTGGGAEGNNMLLVSTSTFDADGHLVESRSYFGSGAKDYYSTEHRYDWRGRRTDTLSPADVVTHYELDNLGRIGWTKSYASDDFDLAASELRAQTQTLYDNRGRVYESRTYEVDPTDGTVGDYLPSYTWYDARSYTVKTASANGLFQKYQYDGLGRLVASYTCFDTDEQTYQEALDTAGDTVVEQQQTWYDAAGHTVATATFMRLPDDTNTVGPLSASGSYATASVTWYDGAGRTIATVDYGREDTASGLTHYFFDGTTGELIDQNQDGIPDVAESAPPQPYPDDPDSQAGIDFQLQLIQYNAAGRLWRTVDNLGRIHETQYDDAGHTVRTIENYDDGQVDETDTDCDITVEYQYGSGSRLVTMTVYNARGAGNGVQQQATRYLYTSPINASWQTAVVYPDSQDVLEQDPTTGLWSFSEDSGDHVSTTYDRLGRTTSTTDQRGVVHQYSFDSAGRPAADTVTDLGSSGLVDGSVRRIGRSYDDIGRLETITSYSDTAGTSVVNQIKYEYNGWGRLKREYQEHDGQVDAASPYVEYTYDDGASGGVARYVRLSQVRYPNGRSVQYDYGQAQAVDDIMSRISSIGHASGTYSAYKYLGAGRIVEEDYSDIQVRLSYLNNQGNPTGLDRFGCVVDQLWTDYGSNPEVVLDHYSYTYDRAGNRTSRSNELNTNLSESYDYDEVDRLVAWSLDGVEQKTWGLDALGNDTAAGTYNAANEMTPNEGSAEYDAAGNMTTLRNGYTAVWDAWNRLVEVRDGETIIQQHEYDGTGRRIELRTNFDDQSPGTVEHHYHNDRQVIETRTFVDGQRSGGHQYLWSPRYIDAPILRDTLTTDGTSMVTAQRVFYLADANYNITGLVKYDQQSGQWQVVERHSYTPYGQVTYRTADWTETTSSANGNTVLYTGRTLDVLTGLYYYRARYYDPLLERFISRDPIESEPNLYRYVLDNPLVLLDPHGMSYEESCIANCLKTCNEEFDWWNPQRYICRAYCDNTCTNTPDLLDRLYRQCARIRTIFNNPAVNCACSVLQALDIVPGIGKHPAVVAGDAVCSGLGAAVATCDAVDSGSVMDYFRAGMLISMAIGDVAAELLPTAGSTLADLALAGIQNIVGSGNPLGPQLKCICDTGTTISDMFNCFVEAVAQLEWELRHGYLEHLPH